MGAFNDPTPTDFQNFFVRDFPYGSDPTTVMASDIETAIQEAAQWMDQSTLFNNQNSYTTYFLYLTAHFLVLNLRNSSQGIAGQYQWLTSSKGVGSVSEGISIPERVMENPQLAMLTKTTYGSKFLFYILPLLTGNVFSVCRMTNP